MRPSPWNEPGDERVEVVRNAKATNCYEECNQSYQTCPVECMGTPAQCSDGYQVCVDSCNRGVGPWLIC
jgi:hypothetical protein